MALALLANPAAAEGPSFRARVVAIHDGDTLTVSRGDTEIKVRLEGIDAPELGQPYSRVARQRAVQLALHREVEVVGTEVDSYGRLLARVFAEGRDLGEVLVREGLAWHFVRYSSDRALAVAEQQARSGRLGLWRETSPIAPWDWRQANRLSPAPPSAGVLHGNTGSLHYHWPGCKNYGCRNCTRVFGSPEEAAAAGYRPAGCCQRSDASAVSGSREP
jgi:endonuclease YncB( thermonuclease family)